MPSYLFVACSWLAHGSVGWKKDARQKEFECKRLAFRFVFCCILLRAFSSCGFAQEVPATIHDLWVWKSPTGLAAAHGAEALEEFCKSQGLNEVYVSVSKRSEAAEETQLVHLIALLHRSGVRVEAQTGKVGRG